MQCPTCESAILKPTKLEAGLSAMGCAGCNGALVSLLYYRDWAEREALRGTTLAVSGEAATIVDTQNALHCPKCSKLMTKYRISSQTGNRLDVCYGCDEAWLDNGEWTLLKSLDQALNLPTIFTEAWQRRIRQEMTEQARNERQLAQLGESDYSEAHRVRNWLDGHPQRLMILGILSQE